MPHGIDSLPAVKYLKAPPVDVFGKGLRQKLLASGSPLEKSYLNILVDEIVVKNKTAIIRASYAGFGRNDTGNAESKSGQLA